MPSKNGKFSNVIFHGILFVGAAVGSALLMMAGITVIASGTVFTPKLDLLAALFAGTFAILLSCILFRALVVAALNWCLKETEPKIPDE